MKKESAQVVQDKFQDKSGKIHLGFTGTREPLTNDRNESLFRALRKAYNKGFRVLHHGDAIGSDALAHKLASKIGFEIVVHPSVNSKQRAYVKAKKNVTILAPRPSLKRNMDIVNESAMLIARPIDPDKEELRSGTWHTVRCARKKGIKIKMV